MIEGEIGSSTSYVTFLPVEEPTGLEIIDEVQRRRYRMETPTPVSPTVKDSGQIQYPVTEIVAITTSEIVIPRLVGIYIRDESRSMIASTGDRERLSVPEGTHTLELDTQIKTYLQTTSAFEIVGGVEETHIRFDEEATVLIGTRSLHERPAGEITTTEDPHDMMQAVQAFGSALKTTTPERSYPTLRGHPPSVVLGDSLEIPSDIASPETGIYLEIPPERSSLYVVAPLAFYLGATLLPGDQPRLTTDTGFEYTFEQDGFETDVERVLKQVFLLDCLTRTEGLYNLELRERTVLEPRLDIDFESLYSKTISEQVSAYLQYPYSDIEDQIPDWQLTVHADTAPASVELLPFVINDLAVVRTSPEPKVPNPQTEHNVETLTRDAQFTRQTDTQDSSGTRSYIQPDVTNGLEQAWVGDRIPVGANKLVRDAFEHRLERELTGGDISITVVVNDSRMENEQSLVNQVYGNREELPFTVETHENTTVSKLRAIFEAETDFLHFIGHTEQDGFQCVDGKIDVTTLNQTGVDAFLLNSCDSYNQGLGLIEAGSIGGIVTLSDVINDAAIQIGETIAQLLNAGYPLRPALAIVRDTSILGRQYIVVGDGGLRVSQPENIISHEYDITETGGNYSVTYNTYATAETGLGSVTLPHISSVSEYYLSPGTLDTFSLSKQELEEFLGLQRAPVRIDGNLHWSDTLDIDEVL